MRIPIESPSLKLPLTSDDGIRPDIPGSSSTKAPYSLILVILPIAI